MTTQEAHAYPVGKYLVSPLTRRTESGRYAAAVSIRRGTHDRVYRFTPRFATREGARVFAVSEGLSLLHTQDLT